MRRFVVAVLVAASLGCFAVSRVQGDVSLPAVFADEMVLQRGVRAPVWGKGEPGEVVTVRIQDQKHKVTADKWGRWEVRLDRMRAGGPHELIVSGENTLTFENVLVGEVWIAAGQSNMRMRVERSANAEAEIAAANYPRLRVCKVRAKTAQEPQYTIECKWERATPETAGVFTAVGYFFARAIQRELDVPVGIIDASWGGTRAEGWMSREAIETNPAFWGLVEEWREKIAAWDPLEAERINKKLLAEWETACEEARAKGEEEPRKPWPERSPATYKNRPSNIYNGMVHPLMPFATRGVIWYQGESNAYAPQVYRTMFPALIDDWRENWEQGDFPFLFVQLASYHAVEPEPTESSWAEVREAQLDALARPNTAMAVAIDIGDADDIHPKNKQEVGRRLALAALAKVYMRELVYSGPVFDLMRVEGDRIRLTFWHVGSGLEANDGEELRCFSIAGADGKFVWAEAQIEGDTVVVSSEEVSEPVAVRYAWQDNPGEVNFYNKEGLPASPFRTDDWEGISKEKE